jgi:hypothetical protein
MSRMVRAPDGSLVLLLAVRLHGRTPRRAQTPARLTAPPHTAVANLASQPAPLATEHPIRYPALQPVASGRAYRVISQPEQSLVTPTLARALHQVFEEFAQANGFTSEQPLGVSFGRGMLGLHRSGRAADIYAIGEKGLRQWAHEWNAAMPQAATAPTLQERTRLVAEERTRNLGYKLYMALRAHGGWAQPPGYPVQLFGPWTRGEGPHKAISDQLLSLHRDHIHVAK